jgi:hypothetical protein
MNITPSGNSIAIFAEFARKKNIKMKNGLNRRVFNVVEASYGNDIKLEKDGSVILMPGSYRITGFSLVTMQATFSPPVLKNDNNYPGYCLLYPKQYEKNDPLSHNIGIGSPATALDTCPSTFDTIFTCAERTAICLGHQSGEDLNNEVYLSVYSVSGIPSEYHVFARMCVSRL